MIPGLSILVVGWRPQELEGRAVSPGACALGTADDSGRGTRGPGRPPKARTTAAPSGLNGIAGILDAVKDGERERAQLRGALEKIQAILADALA